MGLTFSTGCSLLQKVPSITVFVIYDPGFQRYSHKDIFPGLYNEGNGQRAFNNEALVSEMLSQISGPNDFTCERVS